MAKILDIASYLPEAILSNDELEKRFINWSANKIYDKTGIKYRHLANKNEKVSDMAIKAAQKLLTRNNFDKSKIDMLFLITQTQDQCLPSTSSKIHYELGLSRNCGIFDVNQGCAGYIYGLSIAKSFIKSGDVQNVLMITSDTYSKIIDENDSSVATVFGDGAAATLIVSEMNDNESIGPFLFGTDSSKKDFLNCDYLGLGTPQNEQKSLKMDGPGILNFSLGVIPKELKRFIEKNNLNLNDFDSIVFHQANKFILKKLFKKIGIEDKGKIFLKNSGNTTSSSIPIVLEEILNKKVKKEEYILIAGFGVGLSWGFSTILL